jgi:flavin reductase (DIM6/NTAB) family NADH-FMN oxidoreductase RutF/DNA-binding MarR family transcriptional regulator
MAGPSGEARLFRDALGAFATGVTIVTTVDPSGRDIGLTASSFNSVSLDPPMVLWSLSRSSSSLPAFMAAPWFAVHVLAHDQDQLSARFAQRGINRFDGLDVERGHGGVPLLNGCAARFECRTEFRYEGGDHVIFVGHVERFEHVRRTPLVFHGGQYALAVNKSKDEPAAADSAEPDSSFSQDFLIYLLGRAHHQLFLEIRRELERQGLSEDQWFVLSLLGVSDNRRLAELDRMLAYTGKRVTYELVAGLAAADLVRLQGPYDPHVEVALTGSGRRIVIELVSAAKATEVDATRNLDATDIHILKRALRTVVRDTDPGLPTLLAPTAME